MQPLWAGSFGGVARGGGARGGADCNGAARAGAAASFVSAFALTLLLAQWHLFYARFTYLLALLKEYVDAHRVDAEVRALHINLGFAPSRAAEEAARAAAETLGVDIRVVSAGEYLDIIAAARRAGRPVCSVCGTLKRYIINRVPRELGATKVATGHHAHDFLVYYFKNLAGCHHEWNFKILPVVKGSGSALTRIRPLILARPEENAEYCKQARLPFTEACCEHKPERPPGSWVLEMLAAARRAEPDVDIRLVSAIMKFNEKYGRAGAPEGIGRCKVCGEPSGGDVCAVCRLRKLLSRQHG